MEPFSCLQLICNLPCRIKDRCFFCTQNGWLLQLCNTVYAVHLTHPFKANFVEIPIPCGTVQERPSVKMSLRPRHVGQFETDFFSK